VRGCGFTAALCLAAVAASACARDRVVPVYDSAGAIRRLDYDTNRDGLIEMRTYLVDGRAARLEADGNGDGVIDRWEYYGADGSLTRIGTSTASDGREDTWVVRNGGQVRIDIATHRDGVADRHEYHDNGVLVRAEQDTNGDGLIDQWQMYSGGHVSELRLDTSLRSGKPDRRLVYAADGSVQRAEAMDDANQ